MRIQYFRDTDTLYIALSDEEVAETVDFNQNTVFDLDEDGNLVALTLEHAQEFVNIFDLSIQQIMGEPQPAI